MFGRHDNGQPQPMNAAPGPQGVGAPVAREVGSLACMEALGDLAVKNAAPDGSPVREPVGNYKIFTLF